MQRARYIWSVALAFALVLTAAGGVRAADKADHKEADKHGAKDDKHGGDKHGDDKHGSGQLDIFQGALDLAIWTVVVFVLLLFILTKYAWKPMLEGLRKREESIRGAVEEAKIARAETQRMQAEFEKKLEDAHQQIPKLMEEARRKAQEMAEEMRSKANADIAAERQRLRREIDTATDQALQQIWTNAAQIASEIAAKAIRRSLTPDDQQRLAEAALDEMREEGAGHVNEIAGSHS
jgi:F-type H+-transporting ATPase subunit b